MKTLYDHPGHFEAKIKILTAEEGGRETSIRNGIRWNVKFIEHLEKLDTWSENTQFFIWPDFFDENGDSLDTDIWLGPESGELNARMCSLAFEEHMKQKNFEGLKVGTRFNLMEGPNVCAKGVVTKLTGINEYPERKA